MTFVSLLLLAVGLALDAVVVAIGAGACLRLRWGAIARMALVFGGLQAFMPIAGLMLGLGFSGFLGTYASLVGFVLLLGVGLKMLFDAFRDEGTVPTDVMRWSTLLALGVATSIDALVVGITFAFISVPLFLSIATIGVVTAVLVAIGAWLGARATRLLGSHIEVLGALILIALAFKVLLAG